MTATLSGRLKQQARDLGFDACGISPATADPRWRENLARFVGAGYHADMSWLAERLSVRANPQALLPGARAVVAVARSYGPDTNPLDDLKVRRHGVISCYARARDYHRVVRKHLKVLAAWLAGETSCEARVVVDTAPVMEKPLAGRAGVGWQGKHTNLVSRQLGSWFFLGLVITTAALEADEAESNHCGSCRKCLDACPTHAFPAPWRLDARRCISYLTIEHKGHIDREFRAAMGNRIFGCDDCLAVCPWNKFARVARDADFLPRAELTQPRLAHLATLDDAAFRALFTASAVKRTGRNRFVRNVMIALGNSGDDGVVPVVESKLADPSALVRAMAVWALSRLATAEHFAAARACHLATEDNPGVRREWREGSGTS